MSARTGTVSFAVSREEAFDYLVDPHHRAEWQSSLARVEEVAGDPRPGQTWVDVTKPGLRPRMSTTVLERPARWAETGTWRGVVAGLSLDLAEVPHGCTVTYRFRIQVLGPVGWAFSALSGPAVRADLRRAAEILARRS